MRDRLFVAVVGDQKSGKSITWNELFGKRVNTGKKPRSLSVTHRHSVKTLLVDNSYEASSLEVFLISGSNEEKKRYAKRILQNVDCRIVLCSIQYVEEAFERSWDYVFEQKFRMYVQWLNPGHDEHEHWDRLGLVNRLFAHGAVVSVRDGRESQAKLKMRVEEIRQYIHGWAAARGLLNP